MNRRPNLRDGTSLTGCVTSDTCGPHSGPQSSHLGNGHRANRKYSQGFRGAQEMSDLVTDLSCFGFKAGKQQCLHSLRRSGGPEGKHTETLGESDGQGAGTIST